MFIVEFGIKTKGNKCSFNNCTLLETIMTFKIPCNNLASTMCFVMYCFDCHQKEESETSTVKASSIKNKRGGSSMEISFSLPTIKGGKPSRQTRGLLIERKKGLQGGNERLNLVKLSNDATLLSLVRQFIKVIYRNAHGRPQVKKNTIGLKCRT